MVLELRRGLVRLGLVVARGRLKYSPAGSLSDGDEDDTVEDIRTLFFFFVGTDASPPILSPLRALVIAKTLFAPVSRPIWLWWARPLLLLLLLTGIWFANSGKR